MFYTFGQNNSGGSFDFNATEGISHYVIVEADSAKDANEKAQDIGLYFDGAGDCDCCGNRWHEQWSEKDGSATPEVYGRVVEPNSTWAPQETFDIKWMKGKPEGFIHYKNGDLAPFWR